MSFSFNQFMKVTRLTRNGRLMDATRMIQRALNSSSAANSSETTSKEESPRSDGAASAAAATTQKSHVPEPSVSDVTFRDLPPESSNSVRDATSVQSRNSPVENPVSANDSAFEEKPFAAPSPLGDKPVFSPDAAPARPSKRPASFRASTFSFAGLSWAYRLYVPPVADSPSRPDSNEAPALVVLLHGCKQDAADFAKGTAMNALAAERNCLVLYPEQLRQGNSMGCWNWFEPAHQSRDTGEPAMIAALTRQTIAKQGVDPSRVYVAGLSAGGAMAALLAGLYPDLFAAVGVHSGLPAGAASDVMSAFTAMRSGPGASRKGQSASGATSAPAVPVIVFHGSADKTVNPGNAEQIHRSAIGAFATGEQSMKEEKFTLAAEKAGGRRATRHVFRDAKGISQVEYWSIDTGPHAWSGGDASGSYTDPDGPNASRAMLDFFLQHRRNVNQPQ
jgi:poly(hydroxyalkanoate) depolymerase family esterase